MIYFPSPGPVPAAGTVLRGGQDVVLHTEDGLRLGAWFFPGDGGRVSARAALTRHRGGQSESGNLTSNRAPVPRLWTDSVP